MPSVYTCDVSDCDTEYSVSADEDSLFVSYSVSPHDVDGIDKRAFSVCADCAHEINDSLPDGVRVDA